MTKNISNKIKTVLKTVVIILFLTVIVSGISSTNTGFLAIYFANVDGSFNTSGGNVTAKNISSVIHADQFPTIQAAINASAGGIVQVPPGIYVISTTFGSVDGTNPVGLRIPKNVILRGSGKGITILRQAPGLLTQVFIYLSGKNSGLEDITIDYNGFNQSWVTADPYYSAVQLGSQTSSDNAYVNNVEILNAVGTWHQSGLNIIGINLYMAPYAIVKNININTSDCGVFVTKAYDTTISEYVIDTVYANNITSTCFALGYEAGNATINNFYTNNSNPFTHYGQVGSYAKVNNFISRNPKGNIRIGLSTPAAGRFEGIDIDGNGIIFANIDPSQSSYLINPIVKNSVADGIKITTGNINIINPTISNSANSGINFEGSTGKILGGNISDSQYNGITINLGSTGVVVDGINIQRSGLNGNNQFSGVVIASATSNKSIVSNSNIFANTSRERYAIEMNNVGTGNLFVNNVLSPGINGNFTVAAGNIQANNYCQIGNTVNLCV